jgi:hypothetical protein
MDMALSVLFLLICSSWAAERDVSSNDQGPFQSDYNDQESFYTSEITRLTELTRRLGFEEDTGVRDSYEAFASADPSTLRRALYRASNTLDSFDDPSDLAFLATSSRNRAFSDSSTDEDGTLNSDLQSNPEEDLDWLKSIVPSDMEFDAMPHMTWSGFLWSWIPGTSSWSQASRSNFFTNYRPVRLEQVIGTPIKLERVRKAIALVRNVYEAAETAIKVPTCSREKHEILSGLMDLIENLAGSMESCLDHIIVVGDRVRRHDHLTHTIKQPATLLALLERLNSDISLGVGQQAFAYESIQMPLLELQSDAERQKKIARHVYGIWEMLSALQTAFDFILEHVTKQIRLMDALLQHIADRLVDGVQSSTMIDQLQLKFLEAAIMALPTAQTRDRIAEIIKTRLSENQLAIHFDSLTIPSIALPVKNVILERTSELLGVALPRLQKMVESKGSLNRALTYLDFNIGESSEDDY